MGQFLHGSAKTTHAVRAELQRSKAPTASLARRYGINEKTVRKWRSRPSVEDEAMGPKQPKGTVLSALEEAAIVSLRVQARLPLDDFYVAPKDAADIEAGVREAEGNFGVIAGPDSEMTGRDQSEVVSIRWVRLDDLPATDQLTALGYRYDDIARSVRIAQDCRRRPRS